MANETTTSEDPQAGSAEQSTSAQAATNTTPEPQAGEGQQNESISLEDARKLRSEAANLRKRLREAETAAAELKTFKEQIESAQLSETDKRERATQQREKQLADLQKAHNDALLQLQEERVSNAIQFAAVRQGIDPKLAQRLLDRNLLERDDAGYPTNMDEAFKAMVKEFNLTSGKQAPTSGGATNPSRSQSAEGAGEITASYVADVTSGKIPWQSLTPERRTAILNWQAKNPFRF
jgi:hypothetical protein